MNEMKGNPMHVIIHEAEKVTIQRVKYDTFECLILCVTTDKGVERIDLFSVDENRPVRIETLEERDNRILTDD